MSANKFSLYQREKENKSLDFERVVDEVRIAGAEVEWQDKASQSKRRDRSNGRCESGRAKDKKRMEGAQRNGDRGDQDRAGGVSG